MAFDRNDPADLLALKTEVNTDPDTLGYNASSGDTNLILNTINEKRTVAPTYTAEKSRISAAHVRGGTTFEAYDGLGIDKQEWLRWITGSNGVEEESLDVTTDLKVQLYGNGTPNNSMWAVADRTEMVAVMDAIINVVGSRAEDLFGFGTVISRDDWFAARDS